MTLKLLSAIIIFLFPANAEFDSYQVKTNNGIIEGTKNFTVHKKTEFYSFRGIPYAEPPIADLRFRAPVPVSNWKGILDTKKDGKSCVQLSPVGKTIGSEDCLFINIYTPKLPANNSALLPVMLWIHGSIFIIGSGNSKQYGPDYILDENIVVVSLNYRLGIFGFLSTLDEAAPGNFGIKDQLLALKWTRDNIVYFGGDPNAITLVGESAGAVSISILAQSTQANGLFHKAILQSGSTLCLWSLSRHARNVAFATGNALGIFTTDSKKLTERLRHVSYENLNLASTLSEVVSIAARNPLAGLIFAPVIEPDFPGAIYNFKSHHRFLSGNFARIPYLIGFNSEEGNFFDTMIEYLRIYLMTYDIYPINLIPAGLNIRNMSLFAAALSIRRKYFGISPVVITSSSTFTHFISESQFVRPINEMVRLISRKSPVYYYKFSYEGNLGLTMQLGNSKTNREFKGVSHTEEVAYIWITPGEASISVSESDQTVRYKLVKLWTNFIKTSNPTPVNDDLLENAVWPISREIGDIKDDFLYMDIGKDLVVSSNPDNSDMIYWDYIYNKYGNPPYDTY